MDTAHTTEDMVHRYLVFVIDAQYGKSCKIHPKVFKLHTYYIKK